MSDTMTRERLEQLKAAADQAKKAFYSHKTADDLDSDIEEAALRTLHVRTQEAYFTALSEYAAFSIAHESVLGGAL